MYKVVIRKWKKYNVSQIIDLKRFSSRRSADRFIEDSGATPEQYKNIENKITYTLLI